MIEQKKGTLSLSRLSNLKKPDRFDGKIRQSFSHGKTKVVTVEVKRKSGIGKHTSERNSDKVFRSSQNNLTNIELETRIKAVKDAIKENKEQEKVHLAQEDRDGRIHVEESVQEPIELTDVPAEQKDDTSNQASDSSAKVVAKIKGIDDRSRGLPHRAYKQAREPELNEEDFQAQATRKVPLVKKGIKELRGRYIAGSGRISVHNALDVDEGKIRSLASIKRSRSKNKFIQNNSEVQKVIKEVILPEIISVQELSSRMAARTGDVVKALMKLGVMVTTNQIIDADTAELIIMEFGHKVKRVSDSDVEIGLHQEDNDEELSSRPPVVTVMGHVDHGKTSLLDALRKTDMVASEAGGITQCIGAYQITMSDGRKITFIDTPGHAAFTQMRSRGANITDIVVLVVAADDGIKDQTIEAINHARAAGVPLVVAINKMDKHDADSDNVRKDLLKHEVVVESYGGDVMDIEISAKSGFNLQKLEEAILLQAEILDLKANKNRKAEGIVIESKVEKGLGPIATVLVNKGTLRSGDVFVSGTVYGRVRAIRDYKGEDLVEITPGTPGEIIGFSGPTVPGNDFVVVKGEIKAKEISAYRDRKKRELAWVVSSRAPGEQMFSKVEVDEKLQTLSVIIKADVQGSSEAICSSLQKLSTGEVAVKIIHSGIGEITENDVSLANASNALLLGFNVRANMLAREQILRNRTQVKYYSIIYDLINDVTALLSGLLTPDIKENILGIANVRKIFDISKFGKIAGCMVTDGVIRRSAKARLMRDGIIVHTGNIKSVKRNKDDVKEVKSGFECGISLENYDDIHINDVIECFELEEVARQL